MLRWGARHSQRSEAQAVKEFLPASSYRQLFQVQSFIRAAPLGKAASSSRAKNHCRILETQGHRQVLEVRSNFQALKISITCKPLLVQHHNLGKDPSKIERLKNPFQIHLAVVNSVLSCHSMPHEETMYVSIIQFL